MSYLDGVDESERIAAEFWAESRRKRERDEGIAKMPPLEATEAILADAWLKTTPLERGLFGSGPFFILDRRPPPLDEWLAEDNPYRMSPYRAPDPLEVVGLI